MKKTLTAIITAFTLAGCPEKPPREILELQPLIEHKVDVTTLNSDNATNSQLAIVQPLYFTKSFEELLAEPALSVDDFLELVQYVKTPSDLETVIKRKNIHYAKKETDDLSDALDREYGSPLQTHNLGYGVCDELAVYSLPFLLNMPDVKSITLVEISGPKKSDNEELPPVLIFQDRRGRWHPSEQNKPIVGEGYNFQEDAIVAGLHKRRYAISKNVITSLAQDQSEADLAALPSDYKKAVVMNANADNIIKEDAVHALVVFQDRKKRWHFYSNGEFSKETYASAGEATTVVAAGIGYLYPERISKIKTRDITSQGTWLYDETEAKILRPGNEVCLP